jgi:hypothetical protein
VLPVRRERPARPALPDLRVKVDRPDLRENRAFWVPRERREIPVTSDLKVRRVRSDPRVPRENRGSRVSREK